MPERKTTPRDAQWRLGMESWQGALSESEVQAIAAQLVAENSARDAEWSHYRRVKYGENDLNIPEQFREQAKASSLNEVRVPYAMNVVNQYTDGILHGGVTYKIPARGPGPENRGFADHLERWLTAFMRRLEEQAPYRSVVRRSLDDGETYGQASMRLMLAMDNWSAMPQPEDFYFDEYIDEATGKPGRKGLTKEELSDADARDYEGKRKTFVNTFARLPIAWRHVPIRSFYPWYADDYLGGVERTWRTEYEIAEKYRIYFDKGPRTRGKDGKYSSRGKIIGDEAKQSVHVMGPAQTNVSEPQGQMQQSYIADTSTQQMPSSVAEDSSGGYQSRSRLRLVEQLDDPWATYVLVSGKLIARWKHNYGWSPVIHNVFRATSDGGNKEMGVGVVRNIAKLLPVYERHLTLNELAQERNVGNYHILTSSNPDARPPNSSDGKQPEPIQMLPGLVPYAAPGYRLQTAFEQVNPDNTQSILLYGQLTMEQGVSSLATGGGSATSGYDRRQVRADFRTSRDPFAEGIEWMCGEAAKRVLDLLERYVDAEMELYVSGADRRRRRNMPNFYAINPAKDIKGERFVFASVDPVEDSDLLGKIEAGLRAWQGTGQKRGIPHRAFLEEFMGIDNPIDYIQEIREEEFLDSQAIRTVMNKAAADRGGLTKLYLDALRATQEQEQGKQMTDRATTKTDVQGRGYGSTKGQASGVPGVGQDAAPPNERGVEPETGERGAI